MFAAVGSGGTLVPAAPFAPQGLEWSFRFCSSVGRGGVVSVGCLHSFAVFAGVD